MFVLAPSSVPSRVSAVCVSAVIFLAGACTNVTLVEQEPNPCGDGVVDLSEECDDGNREPGDGCDSGCRLEPRCGDGVVQDGRGEECDDGGVDPGDGCNELCREEFCGDGITQPLLDEECDDGGTVDEDGCSSVCREEYCGDGVVQAGLDEECDDADEDPDDGCDRCRPVPLPPVGPCPAGTLSIFDNPDFEAGVLAPWEGGSYDDLAPAYLDTEGCRGGAYCVRGDANVWLRYTLDPPVPVASLVEAGFWAWHDDIEWGMAIELHYADGSDDRWSPFYTEVDPLWARYDVLPHLDATKSLALFSTSGYRNGTPAADVTRFDDFAFCVAR
jgi:cysteine-rich repeat protein